MSQVAFAEDLVVPILAQEPKTYAEIEAAKGRFQVVMNSKQDGFYSDVILLDTATGRTWGLAKNENPNVREWAEILFQNKHYALFSTEPDNSTQ